MSKPSKLTHPPPPLPPTPPKNHPKSLHQSHRRLQLIIDIFPTVGEYSLSLSSYYSPPRTHIFTSMLDLIRLSILTPSSLQKITRRPPGNTLGQQYQSSPLPIPTHSPRPCTYTYALPVMNDALVDNTNPSTNPRRGGV